MTIEQKFGKAESCESVVIGKKATESGVEIYHDGRFVAILTADEIEGLYKSIKHEHIETLKG